MHYVILRDDDTNALTPPECLEELYRPFMDARLPVNLATIPCVSLAATTGEGRREGFLPQGSAGRHGSVPIAQASALLAYLSANPLYNIVQHGLHHDFQEFQLGSAEEANRRLDEGARLLEEAGLGKAAAFVAPHDKFSRQSMRAAARRFPVISTGWFELRRLPIAWWPAYLLKKGRKTSHWRAGGAFLLSHPGCILSHNRNPGDILPEIQRQVMSRELTVLVTHWWEYFPDGKVNRPFIEALHATAHWLRSQPDTRVVSFRDLAEGQLTAHALGRHPQVPTLAGPGTLARVLEPR